MPRYRKLHVKTVESLDLNEMPDDLTRLMWVLLPLALCREGRGLHSGAWLKSRLFPLREDISGEIVQQRFQWFIEHEMVVPYEVDGRSYFYIPTFHKYQGNTIKEAESDYPPPPSGETNTTLQTSSGASPELVQTESVADAVFNTQYSDADANAEIAAVAAPAPAPLPEAVNPEPEQKQEPQPTPRARRKPRIKDPPPAAVECYKSAMELYPARSLWPGIVQVVGDDDTDLDRWKRICMAWRAMGWNPKNVKGPLEYFRDKRIPGDDKTSKGRHQRAGPPTADEIRAGIRRDIESGLVQS